MLRVEAGTPFLASFEFTKVHAYSRNILRGIAEDTRLSR